MINSIYKHKISGEYLQLLKLRENNINTFLQVDEFGKPIIRKRNYSFHKTEQKRIINGFDNLKLVMI